MRRRKQFLWLQYPLGQVQPEGRKQKKPLAGFHRNTQRSSCPAGRSGGLLGRSPRRVSRGGQPQLCPSSRDPGSIIVVSPALSAAHSLLPLALNKNIHHQTQHTLRHQHFLSSSNPPLSSAFPRVSGCMFGGLPSH